MDKNFLTAKLNKLIPGNVLEIRRFGRSDVLSTWVEAESLLKIAQSLKSDVEFKFDWLENISVVEFEDALVVSYFLRSSITQKSLVIRVSTVPKTPESWVTLPSVKSVWTMAQPIEAEVREMFGFRFKDESGETPQIEEDLNYLPKGWKGFPLRKNYVFPEEFFGIIHSRPFNKRNLKK